MSSFRDSPETTQAPNESLETQIGEIRIDHAEEGSEERPIELPLQGMLPNGDLVKVMPVPDPSTGGYRYLRTSGTTRGRRQPYSSVRGRRQPYKIRPYRYYLYPATVGGDWTNEVIQVQEEPNPSFSSSRRLDRTMMNEAMQIEEALVNHSTTVLPPETVDPNLVVRRFRSPDNPDMVVTQVHIRDNSEGNLPESASPDREV